MSSSSKDQLPAPTANTCAQNFYEILGVDQGRVHAADCPPGAWCNKDTMEPVMYEYVAEDEEYMQEAFFRSLVDIPFVSTHMENFVRADTPGWSFFSAPEESFTRHLQSLSDDEGNRPQYVRLVQAYTNIKKPGRNKRKSDGSQNSSECHSVLGATPQSTQEE